MRSGWTNKEAGPVLGYDPGPRGTYPKTSEGMNPAFRKVAVLLKADPIKTLRQLLETLDSLPDPSPDESPMSEQELQRRCEILAGRCDTSVLRGTR